MCLFILKGSYPKKVIIDYGNKKEEVTYKSSDEFKNDITTLLALSKNEVVLLELDFNFCRPICFKNIYLTLFNQKYTNLSNYSSINFYSYYEKIESIKFEDLFMDFLINKDYTIINKLSNNMDKRKNLGNIGAQLIKITLMDLFYDQDTSNIDINELIKDFMTDEHYRIIFNYYNLDMITIKNDIDINNIKDIINSLFYLYFKKHNSLNDLKIIMFNFLNIVEADLLDFSNEKESYAKLANYLLQISSSGKEEITFKEIEHYSAHKLNSKMLMYSYMLEDFGFKFIKFDFVKQVANFKLNFD